MEFSEGRRVPDSGASRHVATHGKFRRLGAAVRRVMTVVALCFAVAQMSGQALAMKFAVTQLGSDGGGLCGQGCLQVISASGEITGASAAQFSAFLAGHQQEQNLRPVILIDSSGGTVEGAMQLGQLFRQMGAEVVVGEAVRLAGTDRMRLSPATCVSACVYAFFGGTSRVVPPGSRLGIHRMAINSTAGDGAGGTVASQTLGSQEFVGVLSDYARSMGVDPGLIAQAERIPNESMRYLTQKEIARWGLARQRM